MRSPPEDPRAASCGYRPTYQPRTVFEQDQLEELRASIEAHGILQPVLVTETLEGYRLIAGERRVRAAQLAGVAAVELRAISNAVNEPDRAKWRVDEAFALLAAAVARLVPALS